MERLPPEVQEIIYKKSFKFAANDAAEAALAMYRRKYDATYAKFQQLYVSVLDAVEEQVEADVDFFFRPSAPSSWAIMRDGLTVCRLQVFGNEILNGFCFNSHRSMGAENFSIGVQIFSDEIRLGERLQSYANRHREAFEYGYSDEPLADTDSEM